MWLHDFDRVLTVCVCCHWLADSSSLPSFLLSVFLSSDISLEDRSLAPFLFVYISLVRSLLICLPVTLFGSLGCQFACFIRQSVTHWFHCFFALVIRLSFAYLVAWLFSWSSELFNNSTSTAMSACTQQCDNLCDDYKPQHSVNVSHEGTHYR
jgi:hypothetical protein